MDMCCGAEQSVVFRLEYLSPPNKPTGHVAIAVPSTVLKVCENCVCVFVCSGLIEDLRSQKEDPHGFGQVFISTVCNCSVVGNNHVH